MIIVITTRGVHSLAVSVCAVARFSQLYSRLSSLLTVTAAVTATTIVVIVVVVVIIAVALLKSRYWNAHTLPPLRHTHWHK